MTNEEMKNIEEKLELINKEIHNHTHAINELTKEYYELMNMIRSRVVT